MNKVAKITLSGVIIAGLAVGGLTYAGAQTGHSKETPKAHYHVAKQTSSKKASSSSKSSSSKPSSSSNSSVSTTSTSAVSSSQQAQQPAVSSTESQAQSSVSQTQQSSANNDYYTKPVDQYGHTQAERDAGGAGYDGACQASEDKYKAQDDQTPSEDYRHADASIGDDPNKPTSEWQHPENDPWIADQMKDNGGK